MVKGVCLAETKSNPAMKKSHLTFIVYMVYFMQRCEGQLLFLRRREMAKSRTSTKTKPSSSGSARLRALGKKTPKATSSTPVVNVTDGKQLKAIQAIVDAKNAKKAAETAIMLAEGQFRNVATDKFETRCRQDGTLHTSVRLMGNLVLTDGTSKTPSILFTQPRRCCKMEEDDTSDPLHVIFGKDFDDLFKPQRTIEINTDLLTDEQIDDALTALQDALGDQYDDAIDSECLIVPRDAFYGRRILDDRIRKLARRASDDGYAKPTKASFKL